jgi:uncharacterized BrkB/YihY/UPF0761 family membrane protein
MPNTQKAILRALGVKPFLKWKFILTTILFFAFSVVLHLMLCYIILPRRVIRHLRQSLRDNPVSPPHIAMSELF